MKKVQFTIGKFVFQLYTHNPRISLDYHQDLTDFLSEHQKKPDLEVELQFEEEATPLPELIPDSWIVNGKVYRIGETIDGRYCFQVAHRFERNRYRTTALVEKDFSRTLALAEKNPETGDSYRFAFIHPTRQQVFQSRLALLGGVLLHGGSVDYEGKGLLFMGRSGVGKSTTIKLWEAAGHRFLNDERNLIYKEYENIILASTPWHGEIEETRSGTLPLAALFFLEQGEENMAVPISPIEAAGKLMANVQGPHHLADAMQQVVNSIGEIVERVPAFNLFCTPDIRAVETAQEALACSTSTE